MVVEVAEGGVEDEGAAEAAGSCRTVPVVDNGVENGIESVYLKINIKTIVVLQPALRIASLTAPEPD